MSRSPLERHIHYNKQFVGYPEGEIVPRSLHLAEWKVDFLLIAPNDPENPGQLSDKDTRLKQIAEAHPNIFSLTHKNDNASLFVFKVRSDSL